MPEKEEPIDLKRLSQRELLIVVATKVEELKTQNDELEKGQNRLSLKVNAIETRSSVWGSVGGFFTALAVVLTERFLK